MNPVKIGLGKSFKGLAAYLLHDPDRAQTAERVGWVQSFNLDDAGPDLSWRLMAATALSADQLKEAAGVKKGPTPKNTAYHFSLTFNPKDDVTEQVRGAAVVGALKALGLENHQALAVEHRDTEHRHVHVMVNLIDPMTGRSAASKREDGSPALISNDQRKLSKWAEGFEREHGLTVTEGRLANANKRAQGEIVDARRKPRNVYEREKEETQDRRRDLTKRQFDERARDISQDSRDMYAQQRDEWAALKASYQSEKTATDKGVSKQVKKTINQIKQDRKPDWAALFARQKSEVRGFEMGERTTIGRIWHAAAVFRDRALDGDVLGGFVAGFLQEERRAIVLRKHDREREKLGVEIREQISDSIDEIRRDHAKVKEQARERFLAACTHLHGDHQQARAAMRERWQEHNADRRAALVTSQNRQAMLERSRQQQKKSYVGRGLEPG